MTDHEGITSSNDHSLDARQEVRTRLATFLADAVLGSPSASPNDTLSEMHQMEEFIDANGGLMPSDLKAIGFF